MDLSRFAVVEKEATLAPVVTFEGRLLCFDQTLAKLGYTILVVKSGVITVSVTGMAPLMKGALKGHKGNLSRSVELCRWAKALISTIQPDLIVNETPPVGGGKMHRPESSLMAAEAVWIAADLMKVPVFMEDARNAKRHLTGNPGADKKLVRAALDERFSEIAGLKPRNEDTYDAIAVGVTWIERNF